MNAILKVLVALLSFLQNNLSTIIMALCAIISAYLAVMQHTKNVNPKLKFYIQDVVIEDQKGKRKGYIVFNFINKGISDIYIEHIKIKIKKNYYYKIEDDIETEIKVEDCEQTFPVCVTTNKKKSVAIPRPAFINILELIKKDENLKRLQRIKFIVIDGNGKEYKKCCRNWLIDKH